MALSTSGPAQLARNHVTRGISSLRLTDRPFSTSWPLCAPDTEDGTSSRETSTKDTSPLFNVQTFTGVRNITHGLYILRTIEETYGPIESYLFPREAGTNEHHPIFFFRFRDPKSINKLAKPYTRLDVPFLALEHKPNHLIGLNDVADLIPPAANNKFHEFRASKEMTSDAATTTKATSGEGETPDSTGNPPTNRSRYAIRIAVSDLAEYPQSSFLHQTINLQNNPHTRRTLADWRSAAQVFRTRPASPPPPPKDNGTQTLDELLQENFNISQNTLVLPQKRRSQGPMREMGDMPQQDEQPSQSPTDYQLFKVHLRKNIRQMREDSSPDPKSSTEIFTEGGSSTSRDVVDSNVVASALAVDPVQRPGSKRERQLEQMRRAATAAQARSVAEQQKIAEEEVAEQSEAQTEAQTPSSQKETLSMWARFMGR